MFLLFGCAAPPAPAGPPEPAAIFAELPALAAAPGPLQAPAQKLLSINAARPAVHVAEVAVLRAAVEQALRADDLRQAARVLAFTRSPEPAFSELAAQVRGRLAEASPAVRAAALPLLAEAMPAEAASLLNHAAEAELRVTIGEPGAAIRRWQGVTRDAVEAIFRRLDSAYVTTPDWPGMMHAVARRLSFFRGCPEAMSLWPALAAASMPTPPGSVHLADLLRFIDSAIAAGTGVPEPVLLAVLTEAALAALDPWTRPVWPAEIASWEAKNAGVVVGVGVELQRRPLPGRDEAGRIPQSDLVELKAIALDSPAWSSGLHLGDEVIEISDGSGSTSLADLPGAARLAAAEAALGGEAGSELSLKIRREAQLLTFKLIRSPVTVETVEGHHRGPEHRWDPFFDEEAGLVLVRIHNFRPGSDEAFDALIAGAEDRPVRGVLLDLRANPGGDIDAAVQIADRFARSGTLARIEGRVLPPSTDERDPTTGEPLPEWNEAIEGHALEGVPVVVLVDESTASAAEVLAAALQQLVGAPVVGGPTYGKGRAQHIYTDPSGTFALQYTNFIWATPSGRKLIHEAGGGIVPDVPLSLSTAEAYQARRMAVARTALQHHADGTPMPRSDPGLHPDIPPLPGDPQLAAAELLLRHRSLRP